MTDLAADPRVVDAEAPQYNARLVRREDMTESLAKYRVSIYGEPTPVVLGRDVHLDYRWAWRNWMLTPESEVSSSELETWLTGNAVANHAWLGLAFWRFRQRDVTIG